VRSPAWLRNKPASLVAAAAAGLALIGLAVAYGGFRAYDFVENDPDFCHSCHTMNRAHSSYMASGHTAVTCHGCHEADIVNNLKQLYHFILERPDEPEKHADVPNGVCLRCHGSGERGVRDKQAGVDITQTLGHKVHEEALRLRCTACHGRDLHQFEATVKACVLCHKDQLITGGKMASNHCASCHPFADSKATSLLPRRADCLHCHEKTASEQGISFPADGPMAWDCGKCHDPHATGDGKPPGMTTEECSKCHQEPLEQGEIHKLHVGGEELGCLECHRPHDWRGDRREACGECHEDEADEDHHSGRACTTCHTDKQLHPDDDEAGETDDE
jgi:hypothetical protein